MVKCDRHSIREQLEILDKHLFWGKSGPFHLLLIYDKVQQSGPEIEKYYISGRNYFQNKCCKELGKYISIFLPR